MAQPVKHATASTAALSTSYRTYDLGVYPISALSDVLRLVIAGTSATSGQSLTVYLSTDSNGDEMVSDVKTKPLQYGATTSTDATVVFDVNRHLPVGSTGPVHLYVHAKLSVGTATGCVPTLSYIEVG